MEVSWRLRFSRNLPVRVLADPAQRAQLEEVLKIESGWKLELTETRQGLEAVYSRA